MRRSSNGMDIKQTVKKEENEVTLTVTVKEGSCDVKMENGAVSVPTMVETSSIDIPKTKRTRQLFSHLPSAKEEALSQFTEIKESIYQYEELGESQQQDVMACECKPLKSEDGTNLACGDNDCINFATSMECTDDECSCGAACRNQRFQRCEYADIDVIQTDKKGYGIRANAAIPAHTFIYEYVGEVIEEEAFRSRMHDYDEEGIIHFYFMMIQQGEYIDATKKGGLGRFLNHSCAPNCYVDKWVVGTKLRMGIFADRNIQAGEELTFDYNVDRYGAEAQPCYCGEPNCIGYIGGKTQSEAQPKLSHAVKEGKSFLPKKLTIALGFDSDQDWATTTSRKRRRAKKDDDDTDEDYVVSTQPKPVTEDGVAKIMSSLLQARERWVIIKLLSRLEQSDDTGIWHRVLKMHGYQILGAVLKEWRTESNIVTTVLHILLKLPRVTKNKIDSSGIEVTVKELSESDDTRVKDLASNLLKEWDALEMGFRISRRAKSANKSASPSKDSSTVSDSRTPSIKPPTPSITVPKQITNVLHRPTKLWTPSPRISSYTDIDSFRNVPRGPAAGSHTSTPHTSLPAGWSSAIDTTSGKTYYYRRSDNKTQWDPPPMEETVTSSTSTLPKGELQRFIEEANKQIAEKEAEKKAEEERKRLQREKEELEAAEAKAKERAERKLQRQQHQHHQHQSHKPNEARRESSSSGKSKLEKQISVQFGKYVPNVIAGRYLTLTRDEIKKYARDIVHLLVSKEIKAGKSHVPEDLSDDKKRKIKVFVKDYMDKVMARKSQKAAAKQQEQQPPPQGDNDVVPGTSESVSTGTPQVPGSTPREKVDVGLETPMSGSGGKTPGVAEEEQEPDMRIEDVAENGVKEGNGDRVFVSPE